MTVCGALGCGAYIYLPADLIYFVPAQVRCSAHVLSRQFYLFSHMDEILFKRLPDLL